jgi:hypothetical protein
MQTDYKNERPPGQAEEFYLIDGNYESLRDWLNLCPSAGTITAWSEEYDAFVIGQTRCKRWSCPHCGPRRIAHLTKKTVDAKPNKLVTLTLRVDPYKTPREAYDDSRRCVSKLTEKIRKEIGEWEYVRVLEVTKKGWPHYHLVVRGSYVQQRWMSDQWYKLTGSWVVDLRKIKGAQKTAAYVMKYLYKQKHVPWTNRRISWTRSFFAEDDTDKPPSMGLIDVQIQGGRPDSELYYYKVGTRLTRIGPDMWKVN